MGKSKPVLSNVLLDMDSPVRDKVRFKSGVELYLDTWGNREEKATPVAQVYSVGNTNSLGLQGGDFVSIAYHVMGNHTILNGGHVTYHNKFYIDGRWLWLATEDNIHAVWRGGWIPVGDWVLLKESTYSEVFGEATFDKIYPDRGICMVTGDELLFDPSHRSMYVVPDIVDGYPTGMGEKYIIMPGRLIKENLTQVKELLNAGNRKQCAGA